MPRYSKETTIIITPITDKNLPSFLLTRPEIIPKTPNNTIGIGGVLKKSVKTNSAAITPNIKLTLANIFFISIGSSISSISINYCFYNLVKHIKYHTNNFPHSVLSPSFNTKSILRFEILDCF